jgi:glycosyltransferase involved in cell wall biosynthesis
LKIAIVHSFYSGAQPSGENETVKLQFAALANQGHDVKLFKVESDEAILGITDKIRTAARVATGVGKNPLREILEFQPDIVHVHNLFPNWGNEWLRDCPHPIVVTLHNFRIACANGTLMRKGVECHACPSAHQGLPALIHRCYRGSALATLPIAISISGKPQRNPIVKYASRVICLSHSSYETFIELGLEEGALALVPNFGPVPSTSFSSQGERGDYVFAGRLAPEKGIIALLENWPTNRSLSIYGDGPLREEVEARCTGNVRFFGNVPSADLPKILGRSKGLVFPSQWKEGAPMIFLDALSVGVPVVALRGNSVADQVSATGCGLVFDSFGEIEGVLTDFENQFPELSLAAHTYFELELTETIWLQRIEAVYRAAIAKFEEKTIGEV